MEFVQDAFHFVYSLGANVSAVKVPVRLKHVFCFGFWIVAVNELLMLMMAMNGFLEITCSGVTLC